MSVKSTEIARLQDRLAVVEASIEELEQNGQIFKKGSSQGGFYVDRGKITALYDERDRIRNKLALWGVYDEPA